MKESQRCFLFPVKDTIVCRLQGVLTPALTDLGQLNPVADLVGKCLADSKEKEGTKNMGGHCRRKGLFAKCAPLGPSWLSWKAVRFCVISGNNYVPAKLLPITFIYPSAYDSMSLLEEVLQYSAYLQVKDLIG